MEKNLIQNETFLGSRVNEKIAQFCVTVKKRTEVVFHHPPNRRHGKERQVTGTPRDLCHIVRVSKSNAQRGKEFREEKRKTSSKSSRKSDKKKANSSRATAKSRSEYVREYQARKKKHRKILS
ncbi:UNVERIFIED_CONTAM: hypothetical protein NCL1_15478 [Trichonephila clavipes]